MSRGHVEPEQQHTSRTKFSLTISGAKVDLDNPASCKYSNAFICDDLPMRCLRSKQASPAGGHTCARRWTRDRSTETVAVETLSYQEAWYESVSDYFECEYEKPGGAAGEPSMTAVSHRKL
jgi:hypothetical protein